MKALSKVTRSIKPAEVEKKWHIIDDTLLVAGAPSPEWSNHASTYRETHDTSDLR